MADLAGWVALVATCIAALMTASNLGPRVTGWGFVVFTVGALAWIVVGFATHQTQLLWSNIFLGLVDLFGIWRWLGRRTRISDTAEAEQVRSEAADGEDLFPLSKLDGMIVVGPDGSTLAHAVDALVGCSGGKVAYILISEGGTAGVGEVLRKLPWREAQICDGTVTTNIDAAYMKHLELAETK
jgi:hypothetical protein